MSQKSGIFNLKIMPKKTVGFWDAIAVTTVACGMGGLLCTPVMGATCPVGDYLENGSCTRCTSGYYCPNENTKIPCPTDTTDWNAQINAMGFQIILIEGNPPPMSWAWDDSGDVGASTPNHCYTGLMLLTNAGRVYIEKNFNGTDYYQPPPYLWYEAAAGYYLSVYNTQSWKTWYNNVRPCTNAPANAHYTGPGTPDSADGSIIDANDCPWECDAGYGRIGDVCQPLCAAGVTKIHVGGYTAPLWATRYTSPTLVIRTADGICYGNLTAGTGNGVNVTVAGTTYHME